MSFALRILPRAERDVQMIFEYIKERSSSGADRWWHAFQDATERVAAAPWQFPFAPENEKSTREIRHYFFKTRQGRTYRGVFIVQDQEVWILRVRGPGQPPLAADELSTT